MRSVKRPKSYKNSCRHDRISRKRYKNTSSRSWGWNDDLSGLFIDDINEAIRSKKSRRTEGKASWKLVPKDSCEVYKDRKKRSATDKRSDLSSNDISNDTESRMDEDKTDTKKKLRKKIKKRMVQTRKFYSKNRRRQSRRRKWSILKCRWHAPRSLLEQKSQGSNNRPVGHSVVGLGQGILDQQGEQDNANGPLININSSLQLASQNSTATANGKLITALKKKTKLSAFTEQRKLLDYDSADSSISEKSSQNYVNSSVKQQVHEIGEGVVEVDVNTTSTGTATSLLQIESESKSTAMKVGLNKDLLAAKENIAVNPNERAPCNSNEVNDVKRSNLQLDLLENKDDLSSSNSKSSSSRGLKTRRQKNKTYKTEVTDPVSVHKVVIKPKRKTNHNTSGNVSMTLAFETNIVCQAAVIGKEVSANKGRIIVFKENTSKLSITDTAPANFLCSSATLPRRRCTVVYEDFTGNISLKQAVPSNIILNNNSATTNKHNAIVFDSDEGNISMRHTLSSKILKEKANIRKTILFNNGACNVFLTQALPSNLLLPKQTQKKCLTKYKNYSGKISDTNLLLQGLPAKKVLLKRQTQQKCRPAEHEIGSGNVLDTQALPSNLILPNTSPNIQQIIFKDPERHRTGKYEDDTENISVIQALLSNLMPEKVHLDDKTEDDKAKNIHTTQSLSKNIVAIDSKTSKKITIVYENDTKNISITKIKHQPILKPGYSEDKPFVHLNTTRKTRTKKRTMIVYDNDESDTSMIESISTNIIEESKNEGKSIYCDGNQAELSVPLAINNHFFDDLDSASDFKTSNNNIGESSNKIKTIADDRADSESLATFTTAYLLDKLDLSITKPQECLYSSSFEIHERILTDYDIIEYLIPTEDMLQDNRKTIVIDASNIDSEKSMIRRTVPSLLETEGIRKTIIFNNDKCNISMKHSTPTEIKINDTELLYATKTKSLTTNEQQLTATLSENIDLKKPLVHVPSSHTPKVVSLPIIPESAQAKVIDPTTDQSKDKTSEGKDDTVIQADVEESKESLSNISDQTSQRTKAILESSQIAADNIYTDSMFYIIKDSEIAQQKLDGKAMRANPNDEEVQIVHLKKKLSELKTAMSQNCDLPSRTLNVDNRDGHGNIKQQNGNSSRANETQHLLDLISSFTGNVGCVDDIQPTVIKVEEQVETTEQTRPSAAPNEQSIDLSRDDLLSNILTALEAIQKSRQVGASDYADERTRKFSEDISKNSLFDDKSISEGSLQCEENFSPLKKTAFGETSYMNETTEKIIPTYLKYVSDEIKEPMLDMIKCASDDHTMVNSGLTDNGVIQNNSMLSAQIQTNLATFSNKKLNILNPKLSAVLVFDHYNPLNNVLLAPNKLKDIHKYNSRQMDETLCDSASKFNKMSKGDYEVKKALLTPQNTMVPEPNTVQQDYIHVYQKGDQFNWQSTITKNKPIPVHKPGDDISTHLKDDEVNTVVAMSGNQELLAASSSLTLFNEESLALANNRILKHRIKSSRSPEVNLVSQAAKNDSIAKMTRNSLGAHFSSSKSRVNSVTKGKKQVYIPSTDKYKQYSPSVSPKQTSKMPKKNTSPKTHKVRTKLYSAHDFVHSMAPEKDVTETNNQDAHSLTRCEIKSPSVGQPSSSDVLVFDQLNPLNNVLLAPSYYLDVHKYNPRETGKTVSNSGSYFTKICNGNDYEVDPVTSSRYTRMPEPATIQDDMYIYQKGDQFDYQFGSSTSGSISVEESMDAMSTSFRDDEVNTLIAMRGNREVFAVSSSLTLVNGEPGKNRVLDNNEPSSHRIKPSKSPPVKLESQAAEINGLAKITKNSLGSQLYSSNTRVSVTKGKKQIYMPTKDKHRQNLHSVTPKPLTKIQKFSTSPKRRKMTREWSSTDDFTHNMAHDNDVRDIINEDYLSTIHERKLAGTKETDNSGEQKSQPKVLVFNQRNPLKNILLSPTYCKNVHTYNPRQTGDTRGSRRRFNKTSMGNDSAAETVITSQYTRMPEPTTIQDDMYIYQKGEQFDLQFESSTSGSISVEESMDAMSMSLRDDNVNILNTMVDDEIGEKRKLTSDNDEYSNHKTKIARLPLVTIQEQAAKSGNIGKLPEISLADPFFSCNSSVSVTKDNRIYIPSTHNHKQYFKFFSVEMDKPHKVTIELSSKGDSKQSMTPEKDVAENDDENTYLSKISEKVLPKTKETKLGRHNITVQQFSTGCPNVKTDFKHNNNSRIKFDDLNKKSESKKSPRTKVTKNTKPGRTIPLQPLPFRYHSVETDLKHNNNSKMKIHEINKKTESRKSLSTKTIKVTKPGRTLAGQQLSTAYLSAETNFKHNNNSKMKFDDLHQAKNQKSENRKSPSTKVSEEAKLEETIPEQQISTGNVETDSEHKNNTKMKLDDSNHKSENMKSSSTKVNIDTISERIIPEEQLSTVCLQHNNNAEMKLDDLNKTYESAVFSDTSFTSSKNLNVMRDDNSLASQSLHRASVQAIPSQMKWAAELNCSNQYDIDSGANFGDKVNMLPFKGCQQCEWEPDSPADTWSFRLLHGRLRLTILLAHRHHATNTKVGDDTPVIDVAVEAVQHDLKNPVVTLCVRFACETMRYIVSCLLRTPCHARDIPRLLRRCTASARVALRWGRAMHDAKSHLAYSLDNDGNLLMKVANVRLHSVWEVTMRIELVIDNTRSVPWPRASDVRVARLGSELFVPDTDVRCALSDMPRDWGHVPRTIWRMFAFFHFAPPSCPTSETKCNIKCN